MNNSIYQPSNHKSSVSNLKCLGSPVRISSRVQIIDEFHSSNGYKVSVYCDSQDGLIAKVIDKKDRDRVKLIQSENINDGLTGQPVTGEEVFNIYRSGSEFFQAIYLPEYEKVYIWPNIRAAGRGLHAHDVTIVSDSHNPFKGHSPNEVAKMLSTFMNRDNKQTYTFRGNLSEYPHRGNFIVDKKTTTWIADFNIDTGEKHKDPPPC